MTLFLELNPIDKHRDALASGADGASYRISWRQLAAVDQQELRFDAAFPFCVRLMAGMRSPDGDWETVQLETHHQASGEAEVVAAPAPWDIQARNAVCDAQVRLTELCTTEPICMHTAGWEDSSELDAPPEFLDHPQWEQVAVDWHRAQVFALRDAGYGGYISINLAPPGGKPWVPRLIEWAASQQKVVVQSNALGAQLRREDAPFIQQVISYPGPSAWQMLCPWTNQARFNRHDREDFGLPFMCRIAKRARPVFFEAYVPPKKADSLVELRKRWDAA